VLADAGHDVVHLCDLGMQRANDREVLDFARSQDRVLVSADTDFGTLLAQSAARRPSVIIFRRTTGRRATARAGLLPPTSWRSPRRLTKAAWSSFF
jgi:hypothetical protein